MRHWKGWDAVNCPNESKLTQSWGEKWTRAKPTLTHPWLKNTLCGDNFRAHVPISTFSNHSSYLEWEVGRDEMLWNSTINPNILHLGVKHKALEPKSSPPTTQKSGCGDGCGWWIQISSLQKHSLYLQWEVGRVGMLWTSWYNQNILHLGVKRRELEPKSSPPTTQK